MRFCCSLESFRTLCTTFTCPDDYPCHMPVARCNLESLQIYFDVLLGSFGLVENNFRMFKSYGERLAEVFTISSYDKSSEFWMIIPEVASRQLK